MWKVVVIEMRSDGKWARSTQLVCQGRAMSGYEV